jgi:cell wall assembly regulator SMI1
MADDRWLEIERLLEAKGCLAAMRFNAGAAGAAIEDLERHVGVKLPESFRSFLLVHDGQADFAPGLLFGEQLLSVSGITRQWDSWRELDEPAMNDDCSEFMKSEPEGYVRPLYTNRKWIPISHDYAGNHMGFDFDPDARGTKGQVITFGRDEDRKLLLAASFDEFLGLLVARLRGAAWNGKYLDMGSQRRAPPAP